MTEFITLIERLLAAPVAPAVTLPEVAATSERPAYIEAHPHEAAAHKSAQRQMFATCRDAGLSTDTPAMLTAINAALGLSLSSRRQLTPSEMQEVATLAAAGYWADGWAAPDQFIGDMLAHQVTAPAPVAATAPEPVAVGAAYDDFSDVFEA